MVSAEIFHLSPFACRCCRLWIPAKCYVFLPQPFSFGLSVSLSLCRALSLSLFYTISLQLVSLSFPYPSLPSLSIHMLEFVSCLFENCLDMHYELLSGTLYTH